MPRVVSALCLCLMLAACSMGHVSLPFTQTAPANTAAVATNEKGPIALPSGTPAAATQARAAAKTGLGGPPEPSGQWPDPLTARSADPGAQDLVNELRRGKGLPPLAISAELTHAARVQAANLARSGALSHIGPDGSTPIDRVRQAGYKPVMAAENIAGGQATIVEAMRSWRESESHLRNMLLPDATHMGIAQVFDPRSPPRTYWTLVLGASR
jgi:uncharacterized protein YkwD